MSNPLPAVLVLALCAASSAAAQQPRPRAQPPRPPADTAAQADSIRIEYRREVFNYSGGSRDPFATLITSGDVGPTIEDLRLVSIIYDARGGNSVAIVQETISGGGSRSHRLRRGGQVGRLRVIQIQPYQVVFQVEEFGFERQQTLSLPRREVR